MTREITYHLARGEAVLELTVEYAVADYFPARTYGLPEDCEPADGGEIEEMTVTHNGDPFALTPEEQEWVEAFIYDTHDYSEEYYDG